MKRIIIFLSLTLGLVSCSSYNCCLAKKIDNENAFEEIYQQSKKIQEFNYERIDIIRSDLKCCCSNKEISDIDYEDLLEKLDFLEEINMYGPIKCAKGIFLIDSEYEDYLNQRLK
jgi:hypothetical protein